MGKRIGSALPFPIEEPIQPQLPPAPLGGRMNAGINVLFQKTSQLNKAKRPQRGLGQKKRYSTDAAVKMFSIYLYSMSAQA